jgi:hypothetical protein
MLFPDVPDVEPEGIGGIVDPCGNGNGGAEFGPRSPAGFKAVERNGTIIYLSDGLMFKNTNHQGVGAVTYKRIDHTAHLNFFDGFFKKSVHGVGINTSKFIDRV